MAKFNITRTQKGLPGTSGSVRDTTDPTVGAGVIGRAAAGLGREIVQFDRREKAIEAARQQMTDGNLSVQADAMRTTADANYETFKLSNSQEKWQEFRDKQTSDLEGQISGLKGMSPTEQARQQAASQRYSVTSSARALTDSTLQLRKDTKIAQSLSITNAFRSGDEDQIEEAVARYMSLGTVMGKGKEEVQADIEAAQEAGAKLRNEDAIDAARDRASVNPELVAAEMQAELDARKAGEGSIPEEELSSEDLVKTKKFAETVVTETKVRRRAEFDKATGVAVADWSAIIADPERQLTATEVWNTPIEVGPEFQGDLGQVRNTWAGIANGMASRATLIQSGKDKKKREDAYSPALVSDLKNRAKGVKTNAAVEAIKEEAAKAVTEDKINNDDLETINSNADKTFDTALDKDLSDKEANFSTLMTRNFQPFNQNTWLQSQITAIRQSGGTLTAERTQDLLATFKSVGKARTWATEQASDEVKATIDFFQSEGIAKPTILSQRELQLTVQKSWLRKTDTQLVEEYETWLNAKP